MGRELGRYEILERIGSGGMAVVYLARQLDLDRLVALKELSQFHAEDRNWASRFLRESRLAGSLTHANIVTVYDYFQADGTPYIAMEYLERGSLRPYVTALDLAQVGGVLRDVLAGLQHAQRRDIVHRDLKPENLLVTTEGQIKIADFGIAKATSHLSVASFNTEAGVAVGTPGYMAPEQAMARGLGSWTDLYALGCMAYEMCAGVLPFTDTTEPFALMLRHISERIEPVRTINPAVPQELSDWIDSLLAKEPSDRVATAAEAWESLDEILFRALGPRWQRESALPAIAVAASAAPAQHFTSALLDPSEIAEHLPEPVAPTADLAAPTLDDVPDALPGPYTPPPGDAIVSAEIQALDPSPPESYVSIDVAALNPPPPRPLGDTVTVTPPPDLPVATPLPQPSAPEPARPAPVDDDFVTFEPWPARRPETVAEPAAPPPPAPPPTAKVTAPSAEPSRPARRGRTALIAGGAVLAAAAVAAAVVLTGGGDPASQAPTDRAARASASAPPSVASSSLTAGPLSLDVPAGWSAGTGADGPKGLELASAVRTVPADGKGGPIVFGLAPTGSTTHALLPKAYLDGGKAPARTETVLGDVHAYRYEGLRDGLTVYAAPTDRGVATIACEAPVTAACASVASTLTVDGAKVLPLGPNDAYRGAVTKALADLDHATADGTSALRAADTPRGQSHAADRVRSRYAAVAAKLRKAGPGPAEAGAARDLIDAVRASTDGYGRLAGAARGSDRGRYNAAAGSVRAARKDLVEALDGLALAGYTGLKAPRASAIPPLERKPVKAKPHTTTTTSTPPPAATATPRTSTTTTTKTPTYVAPQRTSVPKPKPTPVPAKPTPVPIDGDG